MASPLQPRRSDRKRSVRSCELPEPLSHKEEKFLKMAIEKSLVETTAVSYEPQVLDQAPTLFPTRAEFSDPLSYIRSQKHIIAAHGIAKIVPPLGWKPDFALKVETMSFETKRQSIHRLGEGLPYDDGAFYRLKDYKVQADSFRAHWERKLASAGRNVSDPLVWEQAYWEIVEGGEGVQVDYGNDISTDDMGSGFPDPDLEHDIDPNVDSLESRDYYSRSAWNLRKIAFAKGSVLSSLRDRINGVNVPWLYFGMTFATFSWHTEDNWLYSLNYHHHGHSKTWYGVPPANVHRFDQAMKAMIPQRFDDEPQLLQHLVTMMSPASLLSRGISVCRLVQTAGTFVVTLPGAYHAGFSHGFNCAEAVNFATPDWIPSGKECRDLYRREKRAPVIALDKLIWTLAERPAGMTMGDLKILHEQICTLRDEESELRNRTARDGVVFNVRMPKEDPCTDEPDIRRRCVACEQPCSLSTIICSCVPNSAACLRHHAQLCACPAKQKCMVYWRSMDELSAICDAVQAEMKKRAR